jgi:nucleotide-binding universal stress UspA family protein
MARKDRQAKCFDLIELTDPVDGLPVGSRGTVTIEGIGQALVDFGWCEEDSPAGCNLIQRVPNGSMKVIESRSFHQALRARRLERFRIHRVLVGYDGSEQGRDALSLGIAIADAEDAELLVASVYEPESVFDGGDRYMPGVDERRARAKQEAEMAHRFAEVDTQLAGRPYRQSRLWGSPARELTVLAESADVDLIVVGSTHEGKLGRVLPGSVGERLLSGAPCAVAVPPRGFARRDHSGLGLVGVGFDGTEESKVAMAWAASLARQLHTRLRLIAAVPEFTPMVPLPGQPTSAQYQDFARRHFGRLFDTALGEIRDVEGESVVIDGDPAQVLADQGVELDLLVVGSRGYGPLRRVLLGGVSGRVIELAPCPVIVVPRGAKNRPAQTSQQAAEHRGPTASARTT